MPIAELVDYIQAQTQEGVSAQDLRVSLMEAGWHEVDIDNALHDVAAGLHPATPGASIHEDLAQVRGMVAHLAARMKDLEGTIASFASSPQRLALESQEQLPTAFIGAERELTATPPASLFSRAVSLALTLLGSLGLARYGVSLVRRQEIALQDFHIMVIAFGLLALVLSVVLIRQGRAWSGMMACVGALTVWLIDIDLAWRSYHSIGWTVGLALILLCGAILFVIRRWSVRLER
jgi:hypothetical protein